MNYGTRFLAAFLIIALVDTPWLMFNMYVLKDPFYSSKQPGVRIWAAILVYVALAYLLTHEKSLRSAALVGLATYAVYDFTLLAIFPEFSPLTAILDVLWGGLLFGLSYMALDYLGH